jgi:1,4-dihydroxy-6-naphthoate synthase
MKPLTLAYSPCPNDTFIFTPWVTGHIEHAPPVVEQLEDIETLNRAALAGEPDIVKISFHAYGHLRDQYCLLRSGGALGRGCGPLVVARHKVASEELPRKTIAIPGQLTTAALLVRLFVPTLREECIEVMPFNEILAAVRDGEVDAGVIIHESRFTYPRYGLVEVVDLGSWWERETTQAIPLGGIAARRDLGNELIRRIEGTLRASVDFAHAHPQVVWPVVRRHAQEMDDDVMRQHIELYVNDYTRDYGVEGEAAIRYLLLKAEQLGIVPPSNQPLFVNP